jgi:regulator of sirC expression with transglutaminase-like and TPR domain
MTDTPSTAALMIPRLISHLDKAATAAAGARVLNPALAAALSAWLESEAAQAHRTLKAIASPSRGVDLLPGDAYGKPDRALAILAGHHRHALDTANAILGQEPNVNTWTIEEILAGSGL